jgi:single-strand DNA-binding protein
MQKFIGIGNLTKDPENTKTANGVDISKFTLAVKRKFKNEVGEYEADFLNCVAWRKTAELIGQYANKGDKLAVVGTVQTRSYDASDGTKRYVTEIVVDEIEFLTAKEKKESKEQAKYEPINESDLPF